MGLKCPFLGRRPPRERARKQKEPILRRADRYRPPFCWPEDWVLSPYFTSRLATLGWASYVDEKFKHLASLGGIPARVVADYGVECLVHDGADSSRASVARNLRHDGAMMPAVGDWVSVVKRETVGAIRGVVERRTVFTRKAAGIETREQVLAANVDVAFVVAAATDVNARRIERYLTIAWQSGDTPGLREAQLWEGEQALVNVFEDIEELALTCRFTDCAHATEPGCAIKAALDAGALEADRFRSYRKLQRELRAVAAKTDARIALEERKKWKQISVANKVRVRF